jgi:quercetin dioxygenase-like cupin family protein
VKIVRAGAVPSQRRASNQFTGSAFGDVIHEPATGDEGSRVNLVLFEPGARTWWHRHERGQTIYVTAGQGFIKTEGHQGARISAGDTVIVEPGEWHWHGGTPTTFVVHLTVNTGNEGSTQWRGLEVGDAEYTAAFADDAAPPDEV